MVKDLIVEEVHQTRKNLWTECGEDIQKLIDYLQSCERKEESQRFVEKEDIERTGDRY